MKKETKTESQMHHYPVKSTARLMSTREQQLAKQKSHEKKNDHILTFSEVLETLFTSWNSFSTYTLPSFSHFVAHN